MEHPFERLSSGQFRWGLWSSFASTVLLGALLAVVGAPLGTVRTAAGASCDIVSFEVAKTPEHAQAIVDAWNAYGILSRAKSNTWLDCLFLLSYPNLVAFCIVGLLAAPLSEGWRLIGRLLAWTQWLVLISDAIENAALLQTLYGEAATPWPQLAYICAAIKFGFLFEGIVFLPAALLWRLYCRRRPQS